MQKLINSVQNYAWGSKTALTELYGMENPSSQPMAELWMGAHPKSSSRVHDAAGDIDLSIKQSCFSENVKENKNDTI